MKGNARHYFPGNNTPGGFFSYYHYILDQKEARQIWCLKGGPGTGKSSFMRKIGDAMLEEGYNVDFLHCSSDSNSLDGILMRDLGVAMVDGTAPHVIDPKNPGAVDTIINLGDFWDEKGIRDSRKQILEINERIGTIFAHVYHYLRAAESMYDNIARINSKGLSPSVIYGVATDIIGGEMGHDAGGPHMGRLRKFFASAVTPEGLISFLPEIIHGYKKVYVLKSEIGAGTEEIIARVMEAALDRGYDVEGFYCPLKPESKLEHLLIPQLSLAVVTSNPYHDPGNGGRMKEEIEIDLREKSGSTNESFEKEILQDSGRRMEELLEQAVHCLGNAKKEHDLLEACYIPNMNFEGIEALRREIEEQIRKG